MKNSYFLNSIVLIILHFNQVSGQQNYSLEFSSDNFIVQTRAVKTSKGERTVTYQLYQHIPYVANPVDKDFQSLNVYVPIRVDANEVDATNSPIILDIGVGGYMSVNKSKLQRLNHRADLALAAGYVVVLPGCRGRDNQSVDGKHYGKAPAAIVDLKAAVRYIRYNKGIIPGNTERIVTVGCSAGGALSALLGTSGNNPLFDKYLNEIGAANVNDNIYAAACYSPITDLEHADMAYEWMFGSVPTKSGLVNQSLSEQLQNAYSDYQSSLNLQGKESFGTLTAQNYQDYLLEYYLFPSLSKYLSDLPSTERDKYLRNNQWITSKNNSTGFSFKDYLKHIGRMKGLPAFDDFEKKKPEPLLFGNDTINARHFTDFSIQYSTGNQSAKIDADLKMLINMMSAMYFINLDNSDCASYWWIRNGTKDNHTSQTVMINLATKLQNANKEVDTWLFWDGGHCDDYDPEGFIEWLGTITRY